MSSYTKNEKNIYLLNDKNIVRSFDEEYAGVNPIASQEALSAVHEEFKNQIKTLETNIETSFKKTGDELKGYVDGQILSVDISCDSKLTALSNDLTEKISGVETACNKNLDDAKTELESDIKTRIATTYKLAGVMDTLDALKGRIQTYNEDPSTVSSHVGEVYNVKKDDSGLSGQNYVICYDEGSDSRLTCDALGGIVDFSDYYNISQIDEKFKETSKTVTDQANIFKGQIEDLAGKVTSADVNLQTNYYTKDAADGMFETLDGADGLRKKVGELETGLVKNLKFFGEIEIDESDSLSASLKSFLGLSENLALNGLFVYVSVKNGKQTVQTRDGFRLEDGDFAILHSHGDEKYVDLSKLVLGDTLFIQRSRLTYNEFVNLKNSVPTNVSQLSNDSGYLTEHQSLSDYYTKDQTDLKVGKEASARESADDEIRKSIPTKTSQLENDSGFLIKTDTIAWATSADNATTANTANNVPWSGVTGKPDLALKSEIPTKTSQLSNDSGYLTEHQSLSDYYTKDQTDLKISEKQDILPLIKDMEIYNISAKYAISSSSADNISWKNVNDKPDFSHVFVKNGDIISTDLSVIRVSADEYSEMLFNGKLEKTTLYVVDQENINAYDRPIVHVGCPEQPHDAANKEYSDKKTDGVRQELSAALSTIVYVESGNTVSDRLSVIELSDGEYSEKLVKNELKDDVLYIVDQDRLNAYDERIVNVAEPVSPYDAANKYYVDSRLESASRYVAQADDALNSATDVQTLKFAVECLKNALGAIAGM